MADKKRLLIIGGAFCILAGLVLFTPLPVRAGAPQERHFRVEASSYEYAPSILQVNPGDRVILEVVAKDVVHGIYIDGYDLSVEAQPGQTERLAFTADQAGNFRLRCSVACGPLHPFMIGELRVGPNQILWRAGGLVLLAMIGSFVLFRPPSPSR